MMPILKLRAIVDSFGVVCLIQDLASQLIFSFPFLHFIDWNDPGAGTKRTMALMGNSHERHLSTHPEIPGNSRSNGQRV
jgi:hypothetical protein